MGFYKPVGHGRVFLTGFDISMDCWQVPVLCVAFLSCIHPTSAQTHEVVCSGTQNGLSTTGTQENQYKLIKQSYTGCEIIMGNLEITQIEKDWDLSFLGTIREVTGYILIAMNHFRRLPLERLRVIRGNTLYDRSFALSVLFNYPKEGSNGLEHLGFTHLTEILEGGVQIINNRFLSHGPWVNWHDVVRDTSAPIDIQNNAARGVCHASCKEQCWGPDADQCQILTKTVCAPQCNGRCFGTSPRDCCHIECAGGCNGPQNIDCFVSSLPLCLSLFLFLHLFLSIYFSWFCISIFLSLSLSSSFSLFMSLYLAMAVGCGRCQ